VNARIPWILAALAAGCSGSAAGGAAIDLPSCDSVSFTACGGTLDDTSWRFGGACDGNATVDAFSLQTVDPACAAMDIAVGHSMDAVMRFTRGSSSGGPFTAAETAHPSYTITLPPGCGDGKPENACNGLSADFSNNGFTFDCAYAAGVCTCDLRQALPVAGNWYPDRTTSGLLRVNPTGLDPESWQYCLRPDGVLLVKTTAPSVLAHAEGVFVAVPE
jgi:hypothetical protein